MPVLSYDTLDQVPEGLREVARQDGDRVLVNVVPSAKLDEFRDTNINLVKERDTLKERVGLLEPIVGDDPEAFKQQLTELRSVDQRVKDGQLREGRHVEEEVIRRTEDMKKTLEAEIRQEKKESGHWRQKASELEGSLKRTWVDQTIKDACVAPDSGVNPAAIDDIVQRARQTWRATEDGKVLAYSGELQLYGADGGSPLSPKEWLVKLKEERPFFFMGTFGGGAGGAGGDGRRNSVGKTPEQMKGMSAAERLAAANGDQGPRMR